MHMEGEFLRKPSAAIARAIVALCGVIMIILFFFLRRLDPEIRENMDPFGNDYVLLIFGALAILISVLAYFFNRHAYLHLSEEHISARHNWNKRLFCKYSDIAFVEFGPMTLTLTLKNGKTHNFFYFENAEAICRAIRKRIYCPAQGESDVTKMRNGLAMEQKKHKKKLWVLIDIFALIVLNLLFCVLWTGAKEISAFSLVERGFFILFAVIEAAAVLILFVWTGVTGKSTRQLERQKDALRRAVLIATPVLPGNLMGCYIDGNNQFRVTIYGFPNSDEVYYYQENLNAEYQLKSVYQSEIFENEEELLPLTDLLIRVPEPPSSEE